MLEFRHIIPIPNGQVRPLAFGVITPFYGDGLVELFPQVPEIFLPCVGLRRKKPIRLQKLGLVRLINQSQAVGFIVDQEAFLRVTNTKMAA